MATSVSSIRVPDELIAQFDEVATATGRSRNALMIDALRDYIAQQAWFVAAVRRGIEDADQGTFVPDDEMEAHWARWTGE